MRVCLKDGADVFLSAGGLGEDDRLLPAALALGFRKPPLQRRLEPFALGVLGNRVRQFSKQRRRLYLFRHSFELLRRELWMRLVFLASLVLVLLFPFVFQFFEAFEVLRRPLLAAR